jgi:hypothetical protein
MRTSQFSNHFVIAAAPHSGTHRNIGLQRVVASDLTLPTRFSVRGKDEIPMDRAQTTLGSGFVAEGWWVGSAWLELGIIDRRAGRSIDLQVPLVAEARESNTVGYASASAAASSVPPPTLDSGDVYARAKLRALEIRNSIQFICEQLDHRPGPKRNSLLKELAKNAFTIALTEGHRGEIAHVLRTDSDGQLAQLKIKDPSFHNWHGLALAVRENGISDFPLCNKSFDLSYAGHDL